MRSDLFRAAHTSGLPRVFERPAGALEDRGCRAGRGRGGRVPGEGDRRGGLGADWAAGTRRPSTRIGRHEHDSATTRPRSLARAVRIELHRLRSGIGPAT